MVYTCRSSCSAKPPSAGNTRCAFQIDFGIAWIRMGPTHKVWLQDRNLLYYYIIRLSIYFLPSALRNQRHKQQTLNIRGRQARRQGWGNHPTCPEDGGARWGRKAPFLVARGSASYQHPRKHLFVDALNLEAVLEGYLLSSACTTHARQMFVLNLIR